jgi:hypothetical protein
MIDYIKEQINILIEKDIHVKDKVKELHSILKNELKDNEYYCGIIYNILNFCIHQINEEEYFWVVECLARFVISKALKENNVKEVWSILYLIGCYDFIEIQLHILYSLDKEKELSIDNIGKYYNREQYFKKE